jgi:hypothetical protein
MNKIFAVRYIDALYFKKNELEKFSNFIVHVAVGWLSVFDKHIVVCFSKKNKTAERGLLIPKQAIIFEKKQEVKDVFDYKLLIAGLVIGIYWIDIVYFNNGNVPKSPTEMYSEGEFFSITDGSIIIKKPETLALNKKDIINHPNIKPAFCVIPKSFIKSIQIYDKKL